MNTKAVLHNTEGNLDKLRWVFVALLLSAGVYSFHHYESYPTAYRLLALLPVLAIVIFTLTKTQKGSAFWQLIRDASTEAKRVVWPTKQETTQTTLIVVAVVFITGFLLWLLDVLLNWLTSMLMV